MRLALLLDIALGEDENLPKDERERTEGAIADALSGVDAEAALKEAAELSGYPVESVTVLDYYQAYGSGKGLKNLRKLRSVR